MKSKINKPLFILQIIYLGMLVIDFICFMFFLTPIFMLDNGVSGNRISYIGLGYIFTHYDAGLRVGEPVVAYKEFDILPFLVIQGVFVVIQISLYIRKKNAKNYS